MTELDGRTVLVLDGQGEVGATIAARIRQAGGAVACGDGDRVIVSQQHSALVFPFDLRIAENWPAAIEAIEAQLGPLVGLVCNMPPPAAAAAGELDRLSSRAVRRVTLDVTMLALRASIPRLRRHAGSAIVVVSSIAGEIGLPADLMACSVAMAERAMVRSAAMHAREKGYPTRINAVLAGFPAGSTLGTSVPRAVVTPGAVADMVTFLLSDAAGEVTGAEFIVDGGGHAYPA